MLLNFNLIKNKEISKNFFFKKKLLKLKRKLNSFEENGLKMLIELKLKMSITVKNIGEKKIFLSFSDLTIALETLHLKRKVCLKKIFALFQF